METEKGAVADLFKSVNNQATFLKILSISNTRRQFVCRTIKHYNETSTTKPKARSGRPKSVRTSNLKKKLLPMECVKIQGP